MTNHDDLLDSLLAITPEEIADCQARQQARDRALAASFDELASLPQPALDSYRCFNNRL